MGKKRQSFCNQPYVSSLASFSWLSKWPLGILWIFLLLLYCILQNTWELFSPSWVPWECSAWSTFPPGKRNEVWWAPHHGKLPPPLGPLRASLPLLLGSCAIWGSTELLLWIYTHIICCKMAHIQFISLFSSKLPTREGEELIRMQVQPAGLF